MVFVFYYDIRKVWKWSGGDIFCYCCWFLLIVFRSLSWKLGCDFIFTEGNKIETLIIYENVIEVSLGVRVFWVFYMKGLLYIFNVKYEK